MRSQIHIPSNGFERLADAQDTCDNRKSVKFGCHEVISSSLNRTIIYQKMAA